MAGLVWYSDFNGVFNIPASSETVTAEVPKTLSPYLGKHDRISWNPEVVSLFGEVVTSGHFDVTWLTTWNHFGDISKAIEVIGLPQLDSWIDAYLDGGARSKRNWTKWKADAIIADQLRNPRPYIWVDDDAPKFWEDYVRGNVRCEGKVITTNRRTGLTRENLLEILDWSMSQRVCP